MDDSDLTARIQRMLARHAMVGLSLAVVRRGRPVFFHAHGLSNVTSRAPVTPDTAFRIGSLTKTFTAVAVLQLVEQGLVDLDAPVDRYLRSYRLKARATGPLPTVRQLLTHTSGLPELVHPARAWLPVLGETVAPQAAVPPLARYYRGGPRLVTRPGKAFVYSNHGFATLGQLVEDLTGQSLPWYLHREVFEPLGLADTHIVPPGLPAVHRATGYTFRGGAPWPVADRPLVTLGGGAIDSTARDLARYLTALSEGGGNEHGTVLKPDTLSTMYAAQYRPDPRVPGIGLGFHRREIGGRLVVGHDGLMPGFHAQMMLAPDDGIGVVALTNGAHQAMMWLGTEVAELLRELLDVPAAPAQPDVPQHPEVWPRLHGWYALRGSLRDIQRWFITGIAVARRNDRLAMRLVSPIPALAKEIPLHPDDPADPCVFRADLTALGMGSTRVVFSGPPGEPAQALHLEIVPLSFDRRGPRHDPRRWAAGLAGAAAVAATVTAVRHHTSLERNRATP